MHRPEKISRRGKILVAGAGAAALAAMAAAMALRPEAPAYIPPPPDTPLAAAPPTSSPLFPTGALGNAEDPASPATGNATAPTVAGAIPPATSTAVTPSDGGGRLIDNPIWIRTPSPADMLRLYPPTVGGDGEAVIKCVITGDGSPSNCSVISETPANMGFGAAATQLASYYGISPTLADGASTTGAQVIIPIQFHRGSDDQAQTPATTTDAAVPPQTP